MALTPESVLAFLLERGGKAKNSELLAGFGALIAGGDPAQKRLNRELFKKSVNGVAVVRQIDGVKFVVAKKRYREVAKERTQPEKVRSDAENNNNNLRRGGCCGGAPDAALRVADPPGRRASGRGGESALVAVKARPGEDARHPDSVPLEPLAHEWLVKCASGLWGQIPGLLLRDARLAHSRDFVSGFTALHWAAKEGNGEMVRKLLGVSGRRGARLDVDCKARGGYTPLHIAAIHGHADVLRLLVQRYGASVHQRDYGGKKAHHYLGEGVSDEVRALLGGAQCAKCTGEPEAGGSREPVKGFNTISKLFQPGKKQKQVA